MAELTTAVQHNLPVKIVVLKNNSLSEVRFEQHELGNPPYGCGLGPIDFVAFAKACGADGFRSLRASADHFSGSLSRPINPTKPTPKSMPTAVRLTMSEPRRLLVLVLDEVWPFRGGQALARTA